MTKIDDVARLAGVSTATVSRALRGLPVVSEVTRTRVVVAAKQLGYVASPSASRLASGRTGTVGVVVPRVTKWFFATVVDAAEEVLRRSRLDVLLLNLGGREDARSRVFQAAALHKRVDAVMLVSTPLRLDDIAELGRLNLPVVVVGSDLPGFGGVRIDDVAAARTATDHLIGLGHRRIAHIAGDPGAELAHTAHLDRHLGYRQALLNAGIEPDPELLVHAPFTVAGGAAATVRLLRRGAQPTAIFAACDEMALGAARSLREAGLRVPGDVSVVGIDDHDMAAVVGLTTVAQPAADQGRLAASMLLDALPRTRLCSPAVVELPTQLIVRESTAPPPA